MNKHDTPELPRYRVKGPNPLAVNGIPEMPGHEFDAKYWPVFPLSMAGQLEAVNEPAKRILAYLQRINFTNPPIVDPWREDLGRYFLPEPVSDYRTKSVALVSPENVLPGMPCYRALVPFHKPHRLSQDDALFMHRDVQAGDIITTIQWPRRLEPGEFEPANYSAAAVLDYFRANEKHPNLAPTPWDWFSENILLPSLSPASEVARFEERQANDAAERERNFNAQQKPKADERPRSRRVGGITEVA